MKNVIVIGAGISGLTAAVYAQRSGFDTLVLEKAATPLTYQRYCDTWEGSYMTHWVPRRSVPHPPIRYKKGLYFTGQRTSFSGGLPPAAETGRRVAQELCYDFRQEFVASSVALREAV